MRTLHFDYAGDGLCVIGKLVPLFCVKANRKKISCNVKVYGGTVGLHSKKLNCDVPVQLEFAVLP